MIIIPGNVFKITKLQLLGDPDQISQRCRVRKRGVCSGSRLDIQAARMYRDARAHHVRRPEHQNGLAWAGYAASREPMDRPSHTDTPFFHSLAYLRLYCSS